MRRIGLAVLLLLGSVMTAHAGQPPVSVSDARVRWLPGDLPMAGYFVIISYRRRQSGLRRHHAAPQR